MKKTRRIEIIATRRCITIVGRLQNEGDDSVSSNLDRKADTNIELDSVEGRAILREAILILEACIDRPST